MRERRRPAPRGARAAVVYSTEEAPCAQGSLSSVVALELLLSILRGLGGETTEHKLEGERTRVPDSRPRTREQKKRHGRGSERTHARERKDTRAVAKEHGCGSERTRA